MGLPSLDGLRTAHYGAPAVMATETCRLSTLDMENTNSTNGGHPLQLRHGDIIMYAVNYNGILLFSIASDWLTYFLGSQILFIIAEVTLPRTLFGCVKVKT